MCIIRGNSQSLFYFHVGIHERVASFPSWRADLEIISIIQNQCSPTTATTLEELRCMGQVGWRGKKWPKENQLMTSRSFKTFWVNYNLFFYRNTICFTSFHPFPQSNGKAAGWSLASWASLVAVLWTKPLAMGKEVSSFLSIMCWKIFPSSIGMPSNICWKAVCFSYMWGYIWALFSIL